MQLQMPVLLRRLVLAVLAIVLLAAIAVAAFAHFDRWRLLRLLFDQPPLNLADDHVSVREVLGQSILGVDSDGVGWRFDTPPVGFVYDHAFVGGRAAAQGEGEPEIEPEIEPGEPPSDVYTAPEDMASLAPLLECRITPNNYTSHIRLDSHIRPISPFVPGKNTSAEGTEGYINASPMSLPYWAENQYFVVWRIWTDGSWQAAGGCEANICYVDPARARPGERACTPDDLASLGGQTGMRCATPPVMLNVPATAAQRCYGKYQGFIDIPGYQDPRAFWSGRGEPLMLMHTQSAYGCWGMRIVDLRAVHVPLQRLIARDPAGEGLGPLMSYATMTELTRNPPEDRELIEKNWMLFSDAHAAHVHYDLGPSVRTFAQLVGAGLTTPNLTDPYEQPCLHEGAPPRHDDRWPSSWHQATNSLQLVLCERDKCAPTPENTVFWALIHHKHKDGYGVPRRYERYFIVWASTPPFHMLAISHYPVLFANETVRGWPLDESWADDEADARLRAETGTGRPEFASFTYTPNIAYAWRPADGPRDKNIGFLDDEVVLGIGIQDERMGFARALAKDLLQCMRTCPGRSAERLGRAKTPTAEPEGTTAADEPDPDDPNRAEFEPAKFDDEPLPEPEGDEFDDVPEGWAVEVVTTEVFEVVEGDDGDAGEAQAEGQAETEGDTVETQAGDAGTGP